MNKDWYTLNDPEEVASPALLVFPERIEYNIKLMLEMAGGPVFLRPHIKTHKMAEVIQMQMDHGIAKFKCATIGEAELLAKTGAKDILLAMQPVGPNIMRYLDLAQAFPDVSFSCLVDNEKTLEAISLKAKKNQTQLGIYIDLNVGMNRTGIVPGEAVIDFFTIIESAEYLSAEGLHAYDGHIRNPELSERKKVCDAAFEEVISLQRKLENKGFIVKNIVAGGSPTFPIHAKRGGIVASPGTTLLWDDGYGSLFADMQFQCAAVLLTRLISKPTNEQFCLDLGHKSLASEMAFPRVKFLNTDDLEQLGQSEEHFVVKPAHPDKHEIGDTFYAIPKHICPTVAKYPHVITVANGQMTGTWEVTARDHKINY